MMTDTEATHAEHARRARSHLVDALVECFPSRDGEEGCTADAALDGLVALERAWGAVKALERVAPLCGDQRGGWCTTLFADEAGYGWCQVHDLRRKFGAAYAAAVKALVNP